MPITIGALPGLNPYQLINFITRYTSATTKLKPDAIKPSKVANLNPTFVYDVKLSIAAS